MQNLYTSAGQPHVFGDKLFEDTYGANFNVVGKRDDGTYTTFVQFSRIQKKLTPDVSEKDLADKWNRIYHGK